MVLLHWYRRWRKNINGRKFEFYIARRVVRGRYSSQTRLPHKLTALAANAFQGDVCGQRFHVGIPSLTMSSSYRYLVICFMDMVVRLSKEDENKARRGDQ